MFFYIQESNLANVFISKNLTCVHPHRLGKFQKYGRPYNEYKGFGRFWGPQSGAPREVPAGLREPGASDKGVQVPGQDEQGK